MRLTPREVEHLLLYQVGTVAQKRLARGTRLNYVESVALIATQILEFARDGKPVADVMYLGSQLLGRNQVMAGVPTLLSQVQVEATFVDGTKLVTIHRPLELENGNLQLALYGSFLPVPSVDLFQPDDIDMIPGQLIIQDETQSIQLNASTSRAKKNLKITNLSDRPIQIGSHFHLSEANPYLEFDRQRAYGYRLNIPAGTAVRFEPGDVKTVSIVEIGGNRIIRGGNAIATGPINQQNKRKAMDRVAAMDFSHRIQDDDDDDGTSPLCEISRFQYAQLYGPTTGDRIRLGDMDLIIEIESDFNSYGDECKFGGGKVLREGMGQAVGYSSHQVLDLVITNAIVLDYTGIYKADIGIRDGYISGIGKAGNPDVMDRVDPEMIVGVNTEVIAAEGMILTAGGFDAHVHFICPQV